MSESEPNSPTRRPDATDGADRMPAHLGRLEPEELRSIWKTEDRDFTPWLAQPENLVLLSDTIGITMALEAQEKDVGPFRADILCKEVSEDSASDHWILIENQLERTDHTHLGQVLTYAAGLKAVTIVWIAKRFTDEHRAAIDWLNDITDERFNFFGLEVELWRIDDSLVAPKFNVISKPNEWTRGVAKGATRVAEGELSETKRMQFAFWTVFRDYLAERKTRFKPRRPKPIHNMNFPLGRTGFHLAAVASTSDSETGTVGHELRAELVLSGPDAKTHFAQLVAERQKIEHEFGEALTWHNPDQSQMCRIYPRRTCDLEDRGQWPDYHAWLLEKLGAWHKVFVGRVKQLILDEENRG